MQSDPVLRPDPVGSAATAAGHFDLVSHWCIPAPPARVWAALSRPTAWPSWWPQLRGAKVSALGSAWGVGRRCRLRWRTGLGYALDLELEVFEVLPPERLRARATGTLRGEGIWLLEPIGAQADHTLVTHVWRVVPEQPWMRRLAPWIAPLFRWSHRRVMRAGERGLVRYITAPSCQGTNSFWP